MHMTPPVNHFGPLSCHRLSGFHEDLHMIAIVGPSYRPCWLAEACNNLVLLLLDLVFNSRCAAQQHRHCTGMNAAGSTGAPKKQISHMLPSKSVIFGILARGLQLSWQLRVPQWVQQLSFVCRSRPTSCFALFLYGRASESVSAYLYTFSQKSPATF